MNVKKKNMILLLLAVHVFQGKKVALLLLKSNERKISSLEEQTHIIPPITPILAQITSKIKAFYCTTHNQSIDLGIYLCNLQSTIMILSHPFINACKQYFFHHNLSHPLMICISITQAAQCSTEEKKKA